MDAAEETNVSGLPETSKLKESETEDSDSEKEGDGTEVRIPLHRWVMHGAIMFGREFCYAMETALVTPLLLQLGLPEQYYSLTWFLSPILGLLFTPLIGSASDRCTLRWGRRRPFILALCIGVLLGVALFLNGSLIGLSISDSPSRQPVGIILTVIGVVVLDFCADAAEGPIVAYLLDVADTEEQDMALNIHTFSAGLGGAVGYILGGLDWTGTALGQAFKQEQVLFLFAVIVFITSVTLHMFSIPEEPFTPTNQLKDTGNGESTSQLAYRPVGPIPSLLLLDVITEEEACTRVASQEDKESDPKEDELYFLAVERVRSKSDSVLAMPDATIELDSDLDPEAYFIPEMHLEEADHSVGSSSPPVGSPSTNMMKTNSVFPEHSEAANGHPVDLELMKTKTTNSVTVMKNHAPAKMRNRISSASASSRPRKPTFYRQPSFTFSYYGRVSTRHRQRHKGPLTPPPITTSRSLNDLSIIQWKSNERPFQLSTCSLSSEGSSDDETDWCATVRLMWLSMLKMPSQLWRLCVCHLLTWFSIVAQSVFYTDFMGQVIFQGHPTAPANSTELQNYHKGVQMGCWGLVVYAATAAVSSAILQKYLDNYDLSIKVIYTVGTLGFSVGTAFMAIFPNVYVAMVMISTMGVISLSISYCPYALLGQYHEIKEYVAHSPANTQRGFGIDCAILTCQVYISQILVASALGSVVDAVGSVRVIPIVASGGSFFGFLSACFLLIYPDVEPRSSEEDLAIVGLAEEKEQNGENDEHILC
ncbi:solute carrier family 45 member 4-like [Pholidichthys leucotaenia]